MTDNALHTLYRPNTFDEVVGQDAVVKSLEGMIERDASRAYLFAGPSGCGKTTLARIAANALGCTVNDITEIPAAVYTGVDDMRNVQEILQYKPFGGSDHRALILDECHRLSKQAWDSLLKVIEEPPSHVTWFFCTTELDKVPRTIQTRCAKFTLKSVDQSDLFDLVQAVCKAEGIKLGEGIATLITREANGSPRQALVNLALCRDIKDRKTAAGVLKSAIESEATIELCRFLAKGGPWSKAMTLIKELGSESPESVRIIVCNYMAKAMRDAKSDEQVCFFLNILEHFSTPYNTSEGLAPLLLSIGRVLYAAS